MINRLRLALQQSYKVDREVGRGGMATVYLAEEIKHKRPVAIKVLRPEIAASLGPDRFLREIEISANLNHPHILPLLDSGQADGFLYYVMPYVAGESLRERLATPPRISLEEAVRITYEVADALEFAHGCGLIHRDIKPGNILLEHGHAIVSDFGIARAVSAGDDGRQLTSGGAVIGTPAYMSPEQIAESEELDIRSDIYSLGCVLYEILTGEPLHSGRNPQEVLTRRLSLEANTLDTMINELPPVLRVVCGKALQQAPEDRFGSLSEFTAALGRSSETPTLTLQGPKPSTSPGSVKSLAVLPFTNLSPDAEDAYFADGITEEIISALAQVPDLHVAARTSSFAFKGKTIDVVKVGRLLNVNSILDGAVRKAGKRLRITVQLISTKDGFPVWSDRYDRELADVFEIQDDIARSITNALKVSLLDGQECELGRARTNDVKAYELYLEGKFHWARRGVGLERAIHCFQAAIERDPSYAAPYAGLSDAYCILGLYGYRAALDMAAKSRRAAERAVDLAPEQAASHYSLGLVEHFFGWNVEAAVREFEMALELQDRFALVHVYLGQVLALLGRSTEATYHTNKAVEFEPLDPLVKTLNTMSLLVLGRHGDAEFNGRRALELDPNHGPSHFLYAWTLSASGRLEEALEAFERAAFLTSRSLITLQFLGTTRAQLGDIQGANEILREIEDFARRHGHGGAYAGAIHFRLGDKETAFYWMEEAVRNRLPFFWSLATLPWYEDIGADPRWPALLSKHGIRVPGVTA